MNDDEYEDDDKCYYDCDYDEQIDKLEAVMKCLDEAEETIWKLNNRIYEMKTNMELLLIENSKLRKQIEEDIEVQEKIIDKDMGAIMSLFSLLDDQKKENEALRRQINATVAR